MEQKKDIFQILSDFINSHVPSWIFPHKEESLSESGINILYLILLSPLYVIVLISRILFLLWKLFISLHNDTQDNITVQNNNIAQIVLSGLIIACVIFFPIRFMHDSAKKRNVSLIENRYSYDFEPQAIENNMPNDIILKEAFYAIREAMKKEYTARNVVRLRKKLGVDEDFAKGLHFVSPDDFIVYLYSVKEIDKGVKQYINEADSICEYSNLLTYYQKAALMDYMKGNYYNASAEMQHYFNIYNFHGDFPLTKVNNKMHLLRLLLQHRWELSTNRKFAEKAFSCFNNENYDFRDYAYLKSISNGQPFLLNVSAYFEGLSKFHDNNYISALQVFDTCCESTSDTLLKQYCALMSIRAAFWNYDKQRNTQALNLYKKTYEKYSPAITCQYFIPDIQRYQSVVAEIISDSI
jgi:hypothetical protein